MAYIGKSPSGTGVRQRYYFTATGGETTLGASVDDNGLTLSYSDGAYVDVLLNGIELVAGTDYNTNTANRISGLAALAASDVVTVTVYDIFTVADTVSAKDGGTFSGNVVFNGNTTGLDLNGTEMVLDADGDTSITADTDDQIDFKTGGSDRVTIDASGNLLVGKTSSTSTVVGAELNEYGRVLGVRDGAEPLHLNRLTSDGMIARFQKDGSTVGKIGNSGVNIYIAGSNAGIRTGTNSAFVPTDGNGSAVDGTKDVGSATFRFDDVYATNTNISTSDQNEKQQIASLTSAEITAAKAISKLFKTFKWNDSVTENGDNARTHTGVIAQQVETAMTDAGLDAGDYAFFISTDWHEDADGNEVDADAEGAIAKNRKGIRYPELLSFIGAATEQRLADLETRVQALEDA